VLQRRTDAHLVEQQYKFLARSRPPRLARSTSPVRLTNCHSTAALPRRLVLPERPLRPLRGVERPSAHRIAPLSLIPSQSASEAVTRALPAPGSGARDPGDRCLHHLCIPLAGSPAPRARPPRATSEPPSSPNPSRQPARQPPRSVRAPIELATPAELRRDAKRQGETQTDVSRHTADAPGAEPPSPPPRSGIGQARRLQRPPAIDLRHTYL
jgi:hypothetical protein